MSAAQRAISVVRQWLHDRWQLCKAAFYCGQQGYRFTIRTLPSRPVHWPNVDTFGWCRINKQGRVWVEVAYVKGTSLNDAIASAWHEIGHADQYGGTPSHAVPKLEGVLLWEEEMDAWERGLALAGERGYRMLPATAYSALNSLMTYYPSDRRLAAPYPGVAEYLFREAAQI